MLKIGSIILSIWAIINILPCAIVLYNMLILHDHPLGLYYSVTREEVSQIIPGALNTIDTLGLLTNTLIISLCLMMLAIIWKALIKKEKWAFFSIIICVGLVLPIGYISDSYIGNKNLLVNVISTFVFLLGVTFSAFGVFNFKKR